MPKEIDDFVDWYANRSMKARRIMSEESDRGCALYAGAYLDVCLTDLLFVALVADKKIEEELFDHASPLGTFSSRIAISFYMGLISRSCRRDLTLIRKIRNDFAHKTDVHSFDDEPIKSRCRELSFSFHEREQRPRAHFTAAFSGILAKLNAKTLMTQQAQELPDDAPTQEFLKSFRSNVDELTKDFIKQYENGLHESEGGEE